jgi:hypothetical protein
VSTIFDTYTDDLTVVTSGSASNDAIDEVKRQCMSGMLGKILRLNISETKEIVDVISILDRPAADFAHPSIHYNQNC